MSRQATKAVRTKLSPIYQGLRYDNPINQTNARTPMDPVALKADFMYSKGDFNPELGFENSLKIGSPLDIFKTYQIASKNKALNRIEETELIDLLTRCSKGHFGFLIGYTLFKFALQIRQDFEVTRTPSKKMNALVVECAKFIPVEAYPQVIEFVSTILSSRAENLVIYEALIKMLGTGNRMDCAQELFDKIKEFKLDSTNAAFELASAYVTNGHVDKANLVFESLALVGPPAAQYHILLLKGYAAKGDLNQARKFFSKIPASSPPYIRTLAHAALIQCYSERGLPGDANKAYKDCRDEGLPGTPLMFESLIRSYLPAKDFSAASKWFGKVQGTRHSPSMAMHGALIEVQLAADQSLVAWKTLCQSIEGFRANRAKSTRVHFPMSIIEPLMEDLKGKHIDYLRDRMRLALIPTTQRGEILNRLMLASLSSKRSEPDAELCLRLYGEFTVEGGCALEAGVPTNAHITAIKAHGINKNIAGAQNLFDSIIDSTFDREMYAYNALLEVYANTGDKEMVSKYYKDYISNKLIPNISTYESILISSTESEITVLAREIDLAGVMPSKVDHPRVTKALIDNGYTLLPSLLFAIEKL